jgi:hypothetical protein
MLICLILIKCIYYRSKPKAETSKTTDADSVGTSFQLTTSGADSNLSNTSMMTSVASELGISIPGFLQFRVGLDFRINGEIARGGMGSVSLGDAFNPKLKMFGDKIIVKQLLKPQLSERDIDMFY